MVTMKKRYTHLIFDADHTLLNYIADEGKAFCALYKKLGMPITDELLALSRISSESAWTEAGLYNVTDPEIQKAYHALYRTHTEEIFTRIFAKFPCKTATAKQAGLRFLEELKIVGQPLGNALDVIKKLSKKTGGEYAVYIATNGLAEIQRKRLEEFIPYVHGVYVSEDLDSVKPLHTFFERMLTDVGAKAESCLMIGDSLVSDIAGAKSVGIDTCWFNPKGQEDVLGVADMQVSELAQLLKAL